MPLARAATGASASRSITSGPRPGTAPTRSGTSPRVCTIHHPQLVPQGPLLLLGNPNHPAGLSLIHRDDLPTLAELAATHARAGPDAA